ncbi:MAG: hypothetical protein ABH879_09585 [archaeon]
MSNTVQVCGYEAIPNYVVERIFGPDRIPEGYYLIPAPLNLGELVQAHVQNILEGGYAYRLSEDDFFHGHVLMPEPFDSVMPLSQIINLALPGAILPPEQILEQLRFVLYHTREFIDDWTADAEDNVPRSIIGTPNGELAVPEPTRYQIAYREAGSIFPDKPFILDGVEHSLNGLPYQALLEDGSGRYISDGQTFFMPKDEGRFSLRDGQRFETYLSIVRLTK